MVSDEKITSFLRLQQIALDIKDPTQLLEEFLPKVLEEVALVDMPYIFLSAIFIDTQQKVKQEFFVDIDRYKVGAVTKNENIFQKGMEWEMKVIYGEAAVVSNIEHLINIDYPKYSLIKSLLIMPIVHGGNLSGVFVLASSRDASQVSREEIEYAEMITRLVDFSFRLQDTKISLTEVTKNIYQANTKLTVLDKIKDDFVSVASHELRTPMTAIRSYAWMALHRSDIPLSQKLERYLYRILLSTERLISLVNDMLNLSRIEAGKIEINLAKFDLLNLVKDVIEEVKEKANEKRLNLTVLEHKLPLVYADSDKVHQVLLNIIGNSLKFTYPGGNIIIDFFTDEKMLEVSVSDNGAGIAKEDISKLFHKFSRLDHSYTPITSSGGTGLGLFISKNLLELMNGKISVDSAGIDKGSKFTISLPIATKEVISQSETNSLKPKTEIKQLEPVAI